jgi:hypothetical protein
MIVTYAFSASTADPPDACRQPTSGSATPARSDWTLEAPVSYLWITEWRVRRAGFHGRRQAGNVGVPLLLKTWLP